ncbi:hypothetical protein diail_9637 [Diaporthe ilicicola]|nr:hypothetical protein diail_9637 [Diaporthe ilicicola]
MEVASPSRNRSPEIMSQRLNIYSKTQAYPKRGCSPYPDERSPKTPNASLVTLRDIFDELQVLKAELKAHTGRISAIESIKESIGSLDNDTTHLRQARLDESRAFHKARDEE